jgi:hypothetical protein
MTYSRGCKLDLQCCNSYEYCVSCCVNPAKVNPNKQYQVWLAYKNVNFLLALFDRPRKKMCWSWRLLSQLLLVKCLKLLIGEIVIQWVKFTASFLQEHTQMFLISAWEDAAIVLQVWYCFFLPLRVPAQTILLLYATPCLFYLKQGVVAVTYFLMLVMTTACPNSSV